MRKFSVVALFLSLYGCGGGSEFTWDGTWLLKSNSARIVSDGCSCGEAIVDQLPPFEVAQSAEAVAVNLCSGVRCLEILGHFDGSVTSDSAERSFQASGGFGSIKCSDTYTFDSDASFLTFSGASSDVASFRLEADKFVGGGSCAIVIEGSVERS